MAGPGSDTGAADRVLERLAAQLPGYMVPAAITALDELPLTRNGKVDAAVRDAGDGAGSALELVLCAAVADILGLDGVAPGDNFFTLGGDSLSGTRLAGLLGELLGVPVPVKTVFQTPVVRELAEKIAADEQHGAEAVAAAEAFGELEDDGTDTAGANG